MNFKIGDIVICMDNKKISTKPGVSPPLQSGYEYTIHNIYKCPSCNCVSFDVGISSIYNVATTCICDELIPMKAVWWCYSSRFVKKKSKEEMLEEEDYEGLARMESKNKSL